MNRRDSRRDSGDGFTLIEVLVTLLILGLLAGVLFPVVVQQVNDADPVRVSNDMENLRTGIELFQLDLRPREPESIEDLVHAVGDEPGLDGSNYNTAQQNDWDGPYVDVAMIDDAPLASSTGTGFSGVIVNGFERYDADNNATTTAANISDADFVAVRVDSLTASEFELVNDQIDGEQETDANDATNGRVRFLSGSKLFYLATPINQ